jgi:hypothetical protein
MGSQQKITSQKICWNTAHEYTNSHDRRCLTYVTPTSHELSSSRNGSKHLTLSDPMSDLVRHYYFPVPDAFLDL